MTSQERHEARYQRRRAARRARQEARCAALGSLEEVFSYHTMFKYGRKCCNGVRWKQSTQNFERHLFSHTAKQRRLILAKRWRPKKYVHFTVCERGKIRGIDAPHITDRQIHKVISKEVLEPLYDPSMNYDNGASRSGKGLHWQIKRIKQQLARHYRKYGRAGGVLLLDLKKFFPYAPHSIIYQRHQRYIPNPDFRRIADTIIDTAPGEFPGRGMPLGVEPSQQEMAAMPSAVDNWIKCQMSTHSAGHYMDDYCIILPDIEDLKNLGRAIVRQFEIRGIPVNKKKCKIIPLTKPFRWCKARFTLTETGKIKVNGSRDGVIRARRKLKLFHREWLAGKRTLQEVAQYMNCQEAYYKNFDDHVPLLIFTFRRPGGIQNPPALTSSASAGGFFVCKLPNVAVIGFLIWGEGFQHIRIQLAQIKGNALSGIIADHRQNRAIEIILFASAQDAESLLQIIHSKPHPIFVM